MTFKRKNERTENRKKNVINQLLSLYFGTFGVIKRYDSWQNRVNMRNGDVIITVYKPIIIYYIVDQDRWLGGRA